jgi:hypothetical protein
VHEAARGGGYLFLPSARVSFCVCVCVCVSLCVPVSVCLSVCDCGVGRAGQGTSYSMIFKQLINIYTSSARMYVCIIMPMKFNYY